MGVLPIIVIVFFLFAVWGVTTREKHESFRQGAALGATVGVIAVAIGVLLQQPGCGLRELGFSGSP